MNRNVQQALARSARVVGIGFAISTGLFAALYAVQYKNRSSLPFESPREWTMLTKLYVHQALDQHTPEKEAQFWEKAIDSLIKKKGNEQLQSKSVEWLAGYADLLRLFGLAQAKSGEDPTEALVASKSIPYGSANLIEKADLELFQRTGDRAYLLDAFRTEQKNGNLNSLSEVHVPASIDPDNTQAYLELARSYFKAGDTTKALNIYLGLHKALQGSQSEDVLCVRPGAAGMAGQMLWKLGYKKDAVQWLELAERDSSKSQTGACRRCRELAEDLLRRAREQS